jgi:endogenous inhibitor of DNA gyrase (YacG/DUF329 family)
VEFSDPAEVPYRPFCSERCRLIDLGKWFNEDYRISTPLDGSPNAAPKADDEAEESG